MSARFDGLTVALATPFSDSGQVDRGALRRLVRRVDSGGVDQILALGSTGEAALLDRSERRQVLETCLAASGRPVLAGTGASSTRETIYRTVEARELGCAGALIAIPPYVKPERAGIAAHFDTLARAVPGFPLVVYNVPGRTGRNLGLADLDFIRHLPQIVALKESSGDLDQISHLAGLLPDHCDLLSGDDGLALPSISVGAQGLVSVAANLRPYEMKCLVRAARSGDLATARRRLRDLEPLIDALFLESNPIPLKAALSLLDLGNDLVRLPLTTARPGTREQLRSVLLGDAAYVQSA